MYRLWLLYRRLSVQHSTYEPRRQPRVQMYLCVDRVSVGQEPACVKTCPTGAIRFGSKEEMKLYAEQRVADLKSRGYENAGIYDPEGVGGTHVMYVLHHADKPELYSGLPKDPQIDLTVTVWKIS